MSKITLTNLVNLQNETTAVNAINANNAALTSALNNTLSRDGTSPNQMSATLDMNSNRIINLPQALSGDEPVRKTEFDAAVFGSITAINATTTVFEKRSDVAVASIPSTVTSIIIKRFDTGYPAEPAVYVKGVGGTNPLLLTDVNGNNWGVTSQVVYPEYFGAKRDGITDDLSALNAATAYFNTLGITGVMKLRSGTYLMAYNSGFITTYTGVSIVGKGTSSILKVGPNIGHPFFVISPKDITITGRLDNTEYRSFKIDGNGTFNATADYMAGIFIPYGLNNEIDNVTFLNFPGSQPIVIGTNAGLIGQSATPTVDNPKVTNCKFFDTGTATNALCTDFSCIFMIANNALIANNEIRQTNQDFFGTGIEMHATGVCTGNTISKTNQGFIIGANPDTDYIFSNNFVIHVNTGGSVWDTVGGGEAVFNIKALIANNVITTTDANQSCVDLDFFLNGAGDSSIKVIGNYLESLATPGGGSVNSCIPCGRVKNIEIIGNTIKNFSGRAISQGNSSFVSNAQGLRISDNTIVDCCTNSGVIFKSGISINNTNPLKFFICNDNVIENTSTVYMTTGIEGNVPMQATLGKAKFDNNVFINVTTGYNWTGTGRVEGIFFTYSPVITSSSGTPGSIASTGTYRLTDGNMLWTAGITVTAHGSAGGNMFVSLPASYVNASAMSLPVSGEEIVNTGKTVSGRVASGSGSVALNYYDNSTPWADGNAVIVSGNILV